MAVNGLTLISLVAVGAVYGYVRYRLDQIKTIPGLPLTQGSNGAGGLTPMNILLVGDNSRVGLSPSEAAKFGTTDQAGGSHSDVTMILHLDPTTGSVSLLSIPRDLFVPLPADNISGPVGKIDSALNGSNYQYSDGAAQLIATIQNDFGIPINHYVQINFDGFQRTIDALGGINLSFPTQLYDIDAALRIVKTGCLHLDGATALAVVRARHLQYYRAGANRSAPASWPGEQQSDLARILRDHTFLRVLAATVTSEGLTADLGKLNNILGALVNQVTVDPGLKSELIPLVKRFRHASVDAVPLLTLPVSVGPDMQYHFQGGVYGTVDFPVEPADHQVIAEWQGRSTPQHSSDSLTVDPASITVVVQNISSVARQAAIAAAALSRLGYHATDIGQGKIPAQLVETMLRYHPGPRGLAQAESVLRSLQGAVMMQADPTVPDATVAVDTGTSLAVAAASTVPTSAASSAVGPTTTGLTPGDKPVSSPVDQSTPWDPVACAPGQPVGTNG